MDVFYTSPAHIRGSHLTIEGEEFHHLAHVMRKKVGDEIFVADGIGTMYKIRIAHVSQEIASCEIVEKLPDFNEPIKKIILVQSLLKNPAKMDWIVEKTTELGVSHIIPIISDRTLVSKAKIDRWRQLAFSAMKQCMRCRAPEIQDVVLFKYAIESVHESLIFLFHEKATAVDTIEDVVQNVPGKKTIALFVGPEGGFSEPEIELARSSEAEVISLGTRRLRSETAAIAAIARMNP